MGGVTATRHRNPYLARQLRRELVELQCGEEAKHCLRDFRCNRNEAFVLGRYASCKTIKSAPDAFQSARSGQTRKHHARHTLGVQFTGT